MRLPWQKKPRTAAFTASALLSVVSSRAIYSIRGDAESHMVAQVMDAVLNKAEPPARRPKPKQEGEPQAAEQYGYYDDEPEEMEYTITEGGVAIISVHGVMVDAAPSWWFSWYGLCSTPQITEWLIKAQTDQRVHRILLHLDTPGGQASGMTGLADAAFALREQKEVVAYVKDACSAGYFLASQADRVYVAPDGMSGCIGSLFLLSDWSGLFAQNGIKRLRITSTGAEEHKGMGAYGTEITPTQQDDFKRVCDEYQGLFNAAVQRGRGFDDATMAALADGRFHVGQWGVDLNLCDAVATEDAVLTAMDAGDINAPMSTPPPATPPDTDPTDDDDAEQQHVVGTVPPQMILPKPTGAMNNRPDRPQGGANTMPFNIRDIFNRAADEAEQHLSQQSASNEPGQHNSNDPAYSNSAVLSSADRDELTRLRAMEERNITAARASAEQAAVRAFGQDAPRLERAKARINNCRDLDDLAGMQATYEEQTPTTFRTTQTALGRQLGGDEQLTPAPVGNTQSADFFAQQRKEAEDEQAARQGRKD